MKRKVWEEQKQIYLRGAELWDEPIREVIIPHTHAANDDGKEIPLFVRLPKGIKGGGAKKCPVVLLLTGLDGHRPDNTGVSLISSPPEHILEALSTALVSASTKITPRFLRAPLTIRSEPTNSTNAGGPQ